MAASSAPARTRWTTPGRVVSFSTNAIGVSWQVRTWRRRAVNILMPYNCYSYNNLMKEGQCYNNRITPVPLTMLYWVQPTISRPATSVWDFWKEGSSRTEAGCLTWGLMTEGIQPDTGPWYPELNKFYLSFWSTAHSFPPSMKRNGLLTLPHNPLFFFFQVQLKPHHLLCQSLHPTSHLCHLL